ncbi:MAG: hypothetical protein ACWA44_10705 [Thiotrichales bacterium]
MLIIGILLFFVYLPSHFITSLGTQDLFCDLDYEQILKENLGEIEKIAYDATGILLLKRSSDGGLSNATGLAIKMSQNIYGIITVRHAIYNDEGKLFVDGGVFTMDTVSGFDVVKTTAFPIQSSDNSPQEDFIILPLAEVPSNTFKKRAVNFDIGTPTIGAYSAITTVFDVEKNSVKKRFHQNVCVEKPIDSEIKGFLFTESFIAKEGMSGSPVLKLNQQKGEVHLIGIIKAVSPDEQCNVTNQIQCGTYIVTP